MQALDLYVEQKVRPQAHPLFFLDIIAQLPFLFLFDCGKPLQHADIIRILLQFFEPGKISLPAVSAKFSDQRGQLWIAQSQPTALGNAVRLILKTLRVQPVPLFERVVFENFRVDSGYAVHRMPGKNRHTRHMDGLPVNNAVGISLLWQNSLCLQLAHQGIMQHHHIRIHLGNHGAEQGNAPLFQRLRHDGMIGIGKSRLHY